MPSHPRAVPTARFTLVSGVRALLPALGLAGLCLLGGPGACNRDFPDGFAANPDLDTSARGKDPAPAPDSVRVDDMQLIEGGEPASPQVAWFPAGFPDQRYALLSAQSGVARIEDGKVRPVSPGTADITLVTEAGRVTRGFSAVVKAKPKPPDQTIHVISVTAKPMTLWVGQETAPLLAWNPSNATDRSFSLLSQDIEVASIKGGKVRAEEAGTAVVVVTAKDGGKTASFTVTVKEEDKRVRVQSLSAPDLRLDLGTQAEPVLSWTPPEATDKGYKLLTSDAKVVSIQGKRFRAEAAGSAVLMVQPDDDPAKAAAFKVTVTVPLRSLTAADLAFVAGDPPRAPRLDFLPADATDRRWRLLAPGDAAVASVEADTLVRPLAPGETRITAVSLEGDVRAEFAVKVSARVIPVLGVTVGDLVLKPGDPDRAPDLAFSPPDATDQGYSLAAEPPTDPADPAATAVDGKVHPLKGGLAAFRVTPTGGGAPASFKVTILPWLDSVSAEDMLIAQGEGDVAPRLVFHPAGAPDRTYGLASSDPSKVEVAGGLLRGAGKGTAVLTVTSTDGNRQDTFTVTVVPRKCLDILEGRETPADAKEQEKCCRETFDLCPAPQDPPADSLPDPEPPGF